MDFRHSEGILLYINLVDDAGMCQIASVKFRQKERGARGRSPEQSRRNRKHPSDRPGRPGARIVGNATGGGLHDRRERLHHLLQ